MRSTREKYSASRGRRCPTSGFSSCFAASRIPIGLIVDSIADIYTIDADHIQPLPGTWPASRAAFLAGMAGVPAGPMGLLVLEKVVA